MFVREIGLDRTDTPVGSVQETIAVIGLGYVGLPLAVRLAEKFGRVIGFDINQGRIQGLRDGIDTTGEVEPSRLGDSRLAITHNVEEIADATCFIVTVPTPIDTQKRPDLGPLRSACQALGPLLKQGDLVVFESTVYPGVTEDICGPILSDFSGLTAGSDFSLGYSPERINPGDKANTVETIVKNVSADSDAALDRVAAIYEHVTDAGICRCSSIRVAEGAKVLENTQRDVNIALMNELALICQAVGIETSEVIEAASSKWNFVPFTPGLVGGHCIGVDPYYLAALSEQHGLHPEVILAGRRLNDGMVRHVASAAVKMLVQKGDALRTARIGLFGVTFKENVPDIRNSKAIELIGELETFGLSPMIHDAICPHDALFAEGITASPLSKMWDLDLAIVASPHDAYLSDGAFFERLNPGGILMDIRGAYRKRDRPAGLNYWAL
ncbi:nucleotide sugar dehydrogenase [Aestuariibius insulae]|uniref:nucleotide sugar dehydrogenase n=1 Tax=Aestuariibius insulae TaxID=2058287 RepID=UPI00345F1347